MREANAIHGLWIGKDLSKLEHLTIRSFLRHGHPFNLWLYDDLNDELPAGVVVHDASTVLPRDRIFVKECADPGSIVGKSSYGPFSDLFRYKLLHDHGGTWVDMDVTCLRKFDFNSPYLFRAHKLGVVGNLLKAPKGSELMRRTLEMSEAIACKAVPWMAFNRILTKNVYELGLEGYVRDGISNDDMDARDVIQAFAGSGFIDPPRSWYAIHWTNEFWSKKAARDSPCAFPTKDEPAPGSLLHEMYRRHGLVDPRAAEPLVKSPPQGRTLTRTLPNDNARGRASVNMLLPTLNRGGAERIVIDIAATLCEDPNIEVHLYVRHFSRRAHPVPTRDNLHVYVLDQPAAPSLIEAAQEMVARGNPTIFTHLIPAEQLRPLWNAGLLTVPVIHNAEQGWDDDPALLDHPNVPFVVACCDMVRDALRGAGCKPPIITIRHEVTASVTPPQLANARRAIRDRWGIDDNVLLVGMIGQFKSQKAYPRAIRVLAELQTTAPAKLMIVGGWDHNYGCGRKTFEATMRLAVDLGVVADVILAGECDNPAEYFAAFDVLLNTSVFEGLSITMMEAMACGCPIVASAVGGVREIADESVTLIEDGADVGAYCVAILAAAQREFRQIARSREDRALVPNVWLGLSKIARIAGVTPQPSPNGSLFVIDGLHLGGPATSLSRVLSASKRNHRVGVFALTGCSVDKLADSIADAKAELFLAAECASMAKSAQELVDILLHRNFGSVVFWSAPAPLKLLVMKLLELTPVEVIDVSPGPMLFDELETAADFQHRIAFTTDQYFERLDRFVALHRTGTPEARGYRCAQIDIIPLGVPMPRNFIPLPPAELLSPKRFDPAFAIGTVARLVPYKSVELLLEAMAILQAELPKANLTIVGGPDSTSEGYADALRERASDLKLKNVHFAGAYDDIDRFLATWKLFVLTGDRQGCPNASLEAMAMGLPVIAFASGGVREQVLQGKTGYVVSSAEDLAARLKRLLTDKKRLKTMSQNARQRARTKFGITDCAARFAEILAI